MSSQQQSASVAQQQQEQDPMAKVQQLLPVLKETLTNVIRYTFYLLQQCLITDASRKPDLPIQIQRLSKYIEDFSSTISQVQYWLMLAIATVEQNEMSMEFTDEIVGGILATQESSPNQINYSDYILHLKRQVAAIRRVQDMLLQFSQQLNVS